MGCTVIMGCRCVFEEIHGELLHEIYTNFIRVLVTSVQISAPRSLIDLKMLNFGDK